MMELIGRSVIAETRMPKLNIDKINNKVANRMTRNGRKMLAEKIGTVPERLKIISEKRMEIRKGMNKIIKLPRILARIIFQRGIEFDIIRRRVPFSFSPDIVLKVKINARREMTKLTLNNKSILPKRSDGGLLTPDSLMIRASPLFEVTILLGR